MNSKLVCVFPLEIKVRELDARLYLALNLISKGFKVIIGHHVQATQAVINFEGQVIYFCKGGPVHLTQILKSKQNAIIVVLDEEGGIFDIEYNTLDWRLADNILNKIDLYFTWGNSIKGWVIKNKKGLSESRIVISGNPRFDLRKPLFNSFYRQLRNHNKVFDKNYILFNSSFGLGNDVIEKKDGFDEFYKAIKVGSQLKHDYFIRAYHYQKILISYFLEAISYLAEQFPHFNIVVRPHPIEDMETYKNALKHLSNVIISKEGSAHEWIVDAKLMIHHDCTTAVEALFNERPFVSFAPLLSREITSVEPVEISKLLKTKEELAAEIRYIEENKITSIPITEHQKNIVEPIIANISFDATERIVKEVEKRFGDIQCENAKIEAELSKSSFRENLLKLKERILEYKLLRSFIWKMMEWLIGSRKASEKEAGFYHDRVKFPGLSLEEVAKRAALFRQVNSSIPDVNIRKIGTSLYYLEEKK